MGLKITTNEYVNRPVSVTESTRDSCEFRHQQQASFTVHSLPDVTLSEDRFVLMTIRSHDQYNTTIYGLHDRYRGIHGNRRVLFMNALI